MSVVSFHFKEASYTLLYRLFMKVYTEFFCFRVL